MLTAASFLIREYLSENRRIKIGGRLDLYFYLLLSLAVTPIILSVVNVVVVVVSSIPLDIKSLMIIFVLAPLIPASIILYILWKVDSEWQN